MWSLKYGTYEHIYKTDSAQTCGCQGAMGCVGGKDGEFRISRCKLIYRTDKQRGPPI